MATYPKLSSVVTAINCIILALGTEMFEQLARKGTSRKLNPLKLVTFKLHARKSVPISTE